MGRRIPLMGFFMGDDFFFFFGLNNLIMEKLFHANKPVKSQLVHGFSKCFVSTVVKSADLYYP